MFRSTGYTVCDVKDPDSFPDAIGGLQQLLCVISSVPSSEPVLLPSKSLQETKLEKGIDGSTIQFRINLEVQAQSHHEPSHVPGGYGLHAADDIALWQMFACSYQ